MTADEIMAELARLGTEQTKKTWLRHGAREPVFGVKIADLKVIQKRVKKNHALALALYDTDNVDAMYLAGLIADAPKMTKGDLRKWAKAAYCSMVADYAVAGTAAESRFGPELAAEWIDSKQEMIASAGWSTWSFLALLRPDDELDLAQLEKLLTRVKADIHTAPNGVRYAMNGFVIAVGSAVTPLTAKAKAVAKAVGAVEVDMGDTSCQVPDAAATIAKVEAKGGLGRKRKTAMC